MMCYTEPVVVNYGVLLNLLLCIMMCNADKVSIVDKCNVSIVDNCNVLIADS
jgi:hypothetical protein